MEEIERKRGKERGKTDRGREIIGRRRQEKDREGKNERVRESETVENRRLRSN